MMAGKLFDKEAQAAAISAPNSQTIGLLEAVSNPDPKAGKTADITIVDDSALQAETGPLGTAADIDTYAPKSDQISVYVVRQGDSLSAIAQMFNVSVNTIVWANELPSRTIAPGDTLVILPVTGLRYKVKSGDTLKSIAAKFKADIDDIADFNGFTGTQALAIGEEIIIPDGEIEAVAPVKPSTKPASALSSIAGYFIRPLARGVLTQGVHGHNGVDLAASIGEPILAAARGTIIVSKSGGYNGGYGTYLVIAHPNGTQTLYAHNSKNAVKQGDFVERGQIIGYVGNSGKSTGPHLHFEVRGARNPFGK